MKKIEIIGDDGQDTKGGKSLPQNGNEVFSQESKGVTEQTLLPFGAAESSHVPETKNKKTGTDKSMQSRLFFPCNREDALLFLGSLCISKYFPDHTVKMAVHEDGIACLEDGLRRSEQEILQAGRTERFPVLVEIDPDVANRGLKVVEFGNILGLRFRAQNEADDFRFRPVDEFDTETFDCTVESELFELEGDARFHLRTNSADEYTHPGLIADRFAAGVRCLIELGSTRASCRSAVTRFLCGPFDTDKDEDAINFSVVCKVMLETNNQNHEASRRQKSIIPAFIAKDRPTPRNLVESISHNLSAGQKGVDNDISAREDRWASVAYDVIKSKIALDGELLSDAGSIIMRSALLGAIVDNVDSVGAFLDADKPSGVNVTSAAAFFVGFKQGLIDAPWNEKKGIAREISSFTAHVLRSIVSGSSSVGEIFALHTEESGMEEQVTLSVQGTQLAEWVIRKPVVKNDVAERWLSELKRLDYEVIGRGNHYRSWVVRLSSEYDVEVTINSFGEREFPVFRHMIDTTRKLNKAKNLTEGSKQDGLFWRLNKESSGVSFLSCDLVSLPVDEARNLISEKLTEALSVFTQFKKKRGKKR